MQQRADLYKRFLPDWPALWRTFEQEAQEAREAEGKAGKARPKATPKATPKASTSKPKADKGRSKMGLLNDFENKAVAILIGLDDTVDAALFENGDDVTLSCRCGMAKLDKLMGKPDTAESIALRALGDVLDQMQPGHCFGAVLHDGLRAAGVTTLVTPYAQYIQAHQLLAAV